MTGPRILVHLASTLGVCAALTAPPRPAWSAACPPPPPGLGCVSGYVFQDLDHDGFKGPGDPGLPGVQMNLVGPLPAFASTDPTGYYQFPPVPYGLYQVLELVQPGCTPADPPPVGMADVTLTAGTPVVSVDFPNHCGNSCGLVWRWTGGPSIKIADPPNYWPRGEALRQMRPGDAIALSFRAKDDDYMVHTCIDCKGDSTVFKWGSFEDNVAYEWQLGQGSPGSLIHAVAPQENTVLYKIPECGWGVDTAQVTQIALVLVDALNEGFKAQDPRLTGTGFGILMSKGCSVRPGWITVSIVTIEGAERDDEIVPEPRNGTCQPVPPVWSDEAPIAPGGILVKDVPNMCPDYVALLSIFPTDDDKFTIACADPNPACTGSRRDVSSDDALHCEWSLVSGAGAFVTGTHGQVVAFQRSRTQGATVQCIVTDSGTRFADPQRIVTKTLSRAMPVRAFVGIGDVEPPSYHGENEAAATTAVERYQAAGYTVLRDDTATLAEVRAALADPCYQALWLAGHAATSSPGAGNPDVTSMDLSASSNFNTVDVRSDNAQRFGCDQHPWLRELALMGCKTSNPYWYDLFVCAKVVAHKHELKPGPTSFLVTNLTPSKLERKHHFPPPPHNLSLP